MKKFLAILVALFLITKALDALREHLKPEEPPAVQVAQVIDEKLFWLSKSEQKYLPLLIQGAKKIKAENPNCLEITDGTTRPKEYQKKGNPAFYVTCRISGKPSYMNLYFTKSQLLSGDPIVPPAPISAEAARDNCLQAVKQQLHFPSSFKPDNIVVLEAAHSNGRRSVTIDFFAKNGFGNELPQRAQCLAMPDGKVELQVRNR